MSGEGNTGFDIRRLASRIESGAPSTVLFSLAISVVLVTAGIIYVLVVRAAPFYSAFGCGADVFSPPDDWSDSVKEDLWDSANYSDGSIMDPLWLDSTCIVSYDNESMIGLDEPLIVFEKDRDSLGNPLEDPEGHLGYSGNWTVHPNRQYIWAYLDENPEDNYSVAEGESLKDAQIPLGLMIETNPQTNRANEGALILHKSDPDLKRDWFVITWAMSDRSQVDVDGDGKPNIGVDERGTDLDTDIDNDGFDNDRDDDMDNDGIPNAFDPDERIPNVDFFGLFLGLLTIIFVIMNVFAPMWLSRFDDEVIDSTISPLNSFSVVILIISSIGLIYPMSQSSISYLLLATILLAIILAWSSKRTPLGSIAAAFALLWLSILPTHAIQTGHLMALGLSLLLLQVTMSDTRNRVKPDLTPLVISFPLCRDSWSPISERSLGDNASQRARNIARLGILPLAPLLDFSRSLRKFATPRSSFLDRDFKSLLWVVATVALVLSFLDLVARIDGSIGEFLTQTLWRTDIRTVSIVTVSENLSIGVNALLRTTLQVALGALVIAIPLGLGTAIYLSEYADPRTSNLVKPTLEILAGIPSVVYGFFAFVVISPIVMDVGSQLVEWGWMADEPQQFNPINGAIVVGIMITPLIASLSEDALRSVPNSLREASYALGATPVETTFRVVIPSGLSGILASIVLAFSRAIGETMAVTISVGTAAYYTRNMFLSSQTMTAYIAKKIQGDLPAGTSAYYSMFAVGLYLFIITLGLNMVGQRIMHRFREAYE